MLFLIHGEVVYSTKRSITGKQINQMKNRYKSNQPNQKRKMLSPQMQYRLREGIFLALTACAIFLLISLLTYRTEDPGWSSTGLGKYIYNWGGRVGAWLADLFLTLFGIVAYVFPFLIILSGSLSFNNQSESKRSFTLEWAYKAIGWFVFIISACSLASYYLKTLPYLSVGAGGIVGQLCGRGISLLFNQTGGTLVFLTLFLVGITVITGLSWLGIIDRIGEFILDMWVFYKTKTRKLTDVKIDKKENKLLEIRGQPLSQVQAPVVILKPPVLEKKEILRDKRKPQMDAPVQLKPGMLPPVDLLNSAGPHSEKAFNQLSFNELSQLVELRLADFGVDVKVVEVHPGPVVTRFELDLAPGIKVSKISGLAKDIARSLSVPSVRIVEVISGKSLIGLEIPNENRDMVALREMIESQRYAQSRSPLSLVLGKDISGHSVVVDLAKMPHLLVAGTTGSGKSVSLNVMLLSMLYKATPQHLRFILIDPKMLELSVYDGIPHLLTPVITDMKDASNALRWCVAEMDKRYKLMASLGVRNLAGYNQKIQEAEKEGAPLYLPHSLVTDEASAKIQLETLPFIVVVADELADMMMVVGKKVEDLIARIAQKARAAGIHLILATQRPSVDVITGLIKANIPTRIAFQVSSRIDSRTILDQQGAEQLLGNGDMLYLPPGVGVPVRVHGAFVSDEEVHRVAAAWRSYGQPTYLEEVTEEQGESGAGQFDGQNTEQDPLYDEAVRIVIESRKASISLVQRRLRIGYNRAARMMETMESAGVVSTMDNNGSREVLVGAHLVE